MQPTVIVLAKAPIMGRVKRRLVAGLGEAQTLRFYRHCLAGVLRRLGCDPRWQCRLAIAPDCRLNGWPAAWQVLPQGQGDLGQRMLRQLRQCQGPAVLIGGDIPEVTPALIQRALTALRRHPVVFGPSQDGGYWLIGLAKPPKSTDLLAGVRWSTCHALADSKAALGGKAAMIDALDDIDDRAAYRRWQRRQVSKIGNADRSVITINNCASCW